MNHYPDGHNVGLGMVYSTPDEREIERLQKKLAALREENAALRESTKPGFEAFNQCDGCMRGLKLDGHFHRDETGKPIMCCTAYLYAGEPK